jgi:hypothetical protein
MQDFVVVFLYFHLNLVSKVSICLLYLNCHISGIICVFTSSIPRKEICHKLLFELICVIFIEFLRLFLNIFKVFIV